MGKTRQNLEADVAPLGAELTGLSPMAALWGLNRVVAPRIGVRRNLSLNAFPTLRASEAAHERAVSSTHEGCSRMESLHLDPFFGLATSSNIDPSAHPALGKAES